MKKIWAVFIFCFLLSSVSLSQVATERKASEGFFDFNYYRDSRDFNVFTTNLLATFGRFQYFSLTNLEAEINAEDKTDSTLYYTEQNLRWSLTEAGLFSLSLQAALLSGDKNDLARAGVLIDLGQLPALETIFKNYDIALGINLFPLQADEADGYNWQIEYFYNFQIAPNLFNKRLYLAGFADQNIGPDQTNWVTEHQIGYRLVDNLFAVTEFRLNESLSKETGMAYGLEYILPF